MTEEEKEQLKNNLKVVEQTILEVSHAQRVGPSWYTKGETGLYMQVSMWIDRGQSAINEIKKTLEG